MRLKACFLSFFAFLVVGGCPLSAQEASPTPVPPSVPASPPTEPLHILVVDQSGRWEPEQQARFVPPLSLGEASTVSTEWKELLATRPFKFLSYSQRVALMTYPERLLASTFAHQYFSARHVMVIRPVDDGRVQGRLFDTQTGAEEVIAVSTPSQGGREARSDALAEATELAEIATVPVAAHPESELYHFLDASHLSPRVTYDRISTAQRAEVFGFRPCRVCFPETDRSSFYDDIDRRLGAVVAQTIENSYRLAPEGPNTERVSRVGQEILRENRVADQDYRFIVLDSDTINAFAAPTGPLYVTTGMLGILESDDELAAVLGHELSHSERKHARRQYERANEAGIIGVLVTVATGIPWARLGSDILAIVLVRGYSRGYELEADRDGMMAAYAAGYAPEDFLLVQEKLRQISEQGGGRGPGWLNTHPRGEKRLEQLEDLLAETEGLRERLDLLETEDPGTARYLKSQVLEFAGSEQELQGYLQLYEQLLSRVEVRPSEEASPIHDQ